jgi:membrane protease YdiL (CAAX protease family)
VALAVWLGGRLTRIGWREHLRAAGMLSVRYRQLVIAVAAGLLFLGAEMLGVWATDWQFRFDLRHHWGFRLAYVLVVPAFGEEAIFRGFIFRLLRRGRPFMSSAIVSSLLFGLIHISHALPIAGSGWVPWMGSAFTLMVPALNGFALAYLYERGGGSLWGPVVLHAVWDWDTVVGIEWLSGSPVGFWTNYLWITRWILPPVAVLLFLVLLLRGSRARSHPQV